ncbi:MAG: hypothetical protein QNJ54_16530 [Prochloraceae cyanobacterium]|nr:hypothetical protein [Prochloraceae cyanobacterium]
MSDRSDLDLYDRLILAKPLEIPKRSRLFSLEPIGVTSTIFGFSN